MPWDYKVLRHEFSKARILEPKEAGARPDPLSFDVLWLGRDDLRQRGQLLSLGDATTGQLNWQRRSVRSRRSPADAVPAPAPPSRPMVRRTRTLCAAHTMKLSSHMMSERAARCEQTAKGARPSKDEGGVSRRRCSLSPVPLLETTLAPPPPPALQTSRGRTDLASCASVGGRSATFPPASRRNVTLRCIELLLDRLDRFEELIAAFEARLT